MRGRSLHPFVRGDGLLCRVFTVVAGLLVLALLQLFVLMVRSEAGRAIEFSFLLGVLAAGGVSFILVVLAAVILWRGIHGPESTFIPGLGTAGFLVIAAANLEASTHCNHVDPPVDYAIPKVIWSSGRWLFGQRVTFLPELLVISTDGGCYTEISISGLALGFVLLAGWLWFGGHSDMWNSG